jgi:SAM-dependent methyltransferase
VVCRNARHQPRALEARVGVSIVSAHTRRGSQNSRQSGLAARTRSRGDFLRRPFRDNAFDLVTSCDVLYHRWVTDDAAAVHECVRVLRSGALLFVRVPALQWLWGAHDEKVLSRHRYTRGEMSRLACWHRDARRRR